MSKANTRFSQIMPLAALVLIFVICSFTSEGRMISASNLKTVALQSIISMVTCIGATFVMAHGNIDLSLGGVVAIASVAGYFLGKGNILLTAVISIVVAMICNFIVGGIHVFFKVHAFYVGICGLSIGRCVAGIAAKQTVMSMPLSWGKIDKVWFYLAVILVVIGIAIYLFEFTNIGKYNKAIGSNITSAIHSGIAVGKYKIYAYLTSGFFAGVAALLRMIRSGAVTANTGMGIEAELMIGLVIGGISFSGGTNVKITGAIMGALVLQSLTNGLVISGMNADLVSAVKGVVFLIAVYFAYDRSSGKIPD